MLSDSSLVSRILSHSSLFFQRLAQKMSLQKYATFFPSSNFAVKVVLLSTWSQFHLHFTSAFFVQASFWQLFPSYIWLGAKILYKKRLRIMLMKLTHVYAKLLRTQIPKVKKRLTVWLYFLCFWDLCGCKSFA
jgi:hypothetical protein